MDSLGIRYLQNILFALEKIIFTLKMDFLLVNILVHLLRKMGKTYFTFIISLKCF